MLYLYFFKRRPEEQQGSTLGVSFKEVFVKRGLPVIHREEKVRILKEKNQSLLVRGDLPMS